MLLRLVVRGAPEAEEGTGPGGYPSAALVICALNEGRVIRKKLEDSLQLQYPGRLRIVLISDGSTDDTAAIAREFAPRGVELIEREQRRGKVANLNEVVPSLDVEVVVLSDANVIYREDALLRLVARFADPAVGCCSGKVSSDRHHRRAERLRVPILLARMGSAGKGVAAVFHGGSRWRHVRAAPPAVPRLPQRHHHRGPDRSHRGGAAGVPGGIRAPRPGLGKRREQRGGGIPPQNADRRRGGAGHAARQRLASGGAGPLLVDLRIAQAAALAAPFTGLAALALAVAAPRQFLSQAVLAGFALLAAAAAARWLSRRPHPLLDAPFYFLFGQVALLWGLLKGAAGRQSVLWAKANR